MLDFFEHLTRNISMTLIAASVNQMLRATLVLFTAFLSVFYLKNRMYRHHIAALGIIIVGAIFVALSLILYSNTQSKSIAIGITVLLTG